MRRLGVATGCASSRAILLSALALSFLYAQTADSVLAPGEPVRREIAAGASQTFKLHVEDGQFLQLVIQARAVELQVELGGPDGKKLATLDVNWRESAENLPWIASAGGDYPVTIRALQAENGAGSFELSLRALRTPTADDRTRFAAFQPYIPARDLLARPTAQSLRTAIGLYEESLKGWRAIGDTAWEGRTLHQIGFCYESLGDPKKSRDALLQALPLRRAVGNRYGEALTLNTLGVIHTGMGEPAKALEYLAAALEARRDVRDRRGEAVTLNAMGIARGRSGDHSGAVELLGRALEIRREVKDRRGEAVTLNTIGSEYSLMGQFQTALEHLTRSLELRRDLGDKRGEAATLNNLAYALGELGEPAKAKERYLEASVLFETVGDRMGTAAVLTHLGAISTRLDDALGFLERALAMRREMGDRQGEVNCMLQIGAAYLRSGQLQKALENENIAHQRATAINYRQGIALSLYFGGQADEQLGDSASAQRRFTEAASLFEAGQHRDYEAAALLRLAGSERGAGKLDLALEHSRLSMAIAESIRGSVVSPELRAAYRAYRGSHYGLYVSILMDQHRAAPSAELETAAFEATERSRARSFIEMLDESQVDYRAGLTAEQRAREDQILGRINAVQRELFRSNTPVPRKTELDRQLRAAERDLDSLQIEMQKGGRHDASRYSRSVSAAQIRSHLLDSQTALLEYVLDEPQSYVWILTRDGLSSAFLPRRSVIEERVAAYRDELARRASALTIRAAMARVDAAGAQLYRDLIAPIEKHLGSHRRIIIVPDGVLAYLPFEVLGNGKRLIERFAISYSPSASALATLRSRSDLPASTPPSLLAYADPVYSPRVAGGDAERGLDLVALPNTRAEVAAIRALFPERASRVYLGADAREENVKNEKLEQYRYVHFAAHGHYDESHPARSGIVLSTVSGSTQDGVLQVPEVMRLHLEADMVTLSACRTGLGKLVAGEGVMGMARAFLYAGADSVLTSVWNVNDASTAELMKALYRNLNRGLPRDEALREAKLALIRGPQVAWRHPYYWAPFLLLGNAAPSTVEPAQ